MTAMNKPLYRIRRYADYFETYESRRLKDQTWVAVPNKHDGKSFRRLSRLENAAAIYGAWQLILQIASKMPVRGTLCDDDGPLSAADMEDKTGFPEQDFQEALALLCSERIGWIETVEEAEAATLIEQLQTSLFAAMPADSRRPRGTPRTPPADHAGPPADSRRNVKIPASHAGGPADFAVSPADSRTECGDARPSRARAGEPDRTGPDPTRPHPTGPAGAGEREVIERLAPLFNQNPDRPLVYAALHALAAMLPVPWEELEVVAWFYAQPADEKSPHELRTRHTKLKTLFEGWSDAVGVARAYEKKEGGPFSPEKKPAPEPDGWRERLLARFPDAEIPARYDELSGSLKKIAAGEPSEAAA
jgi:hypothetical protein